MIERDRRRPDSNNAMSPRRTLFARVVSVLLLPAGLICLGVPFYMLMQPDRWGIIDDTRAAFGDGRDAGLLKAAYVDCIGSRSGSGSSRGIGITEYGCVIDLAETQPAVEPAPVTAADRADKPVGEGGEPSAGLSYEEAMLKYDAEMARWNAARDEQTRRIAADLDTFIAQSKARRDPSNRIERKLALNYSDELPTVRILSAVDEPRRVGLFWGWSELASRWGQLLLLTLLFFSFGGFCLYAVRLAWWTKRAPDPST